MVEGLLLMMPRSRRTLVFGECIISIMDDLHFQSISGVYIFSNIKKISFFFFFFLCIKSLIVFSKAELEFGIV